MLFRAIEAISSGIGTGKVSAAGEFFGEDYVDEAIVLPQLQNMRKVFEALNNEYIKAIDSIPKPEPGKDIDEMTSEEHTIFGIELEEYNLKKANMIINFMEKFAMASENLPSPKELLEQLHLPNALNELLSNYVEEYVNGSIKTAFENLKMAKELYPDETAAIEAFANFAEYSRIAKSANETIGNFTDEYFGGESFDQIKQQIKERIQVLNEYKSNINANAKEMQKVMEEQPRILAAITANKKVLAEIDYKNLSSNISKGVITSEGPEVADAVVDYYFNVAKAVKEEFLRNYLVGGLGEEFYSGEALFEMANELKETDPAAYAKMKAASAKYNREEALRTHFADLTSDYEVLMDKFFDELAGTKRGLTSTELKNAAKGYASTELFKTLSASLYEYIGPDAVQGYIAEYEELMKKQAAGTISIDEMTRLGLFESLGLGDTEKQQRLLAGDFRYEDMLQLRERLYEDIKGGTATEAEAKIYSAIEEVFNRIDSVGEEMAEGLEKRAERFKQIEDFIDTEYGSEPYKELKKYRSELEKEFGAKYEDLPQERKAQFDDLMRRKSMQMLDDARKEQEDLMYSYRHHGEQRYESGLELEGLKDVIVDAYNAKEQNDRTKDIVDKLKDAVEKLEGIEAACNKFGIYAQ